MTGDLVGVGREDAQKDTQGSGIDVLDRIDELLADRKCPHCERDWHRGALTRDVLRMFESGHLNPNYFSSKDTSPVLCDGSEFIGPLRPKHEPITFATGGVVTWLDEAITMTTNYAIAELSSHHYYQWTPNWHITYGGYSQKFVLGVNPGAPWFTGWDHDWNKVWSTKPEPEPLEDICEAPDVDVEFGPQNWVFTDRTAPPTYLHGLVSERWHAFNRNDTPMPTPKPMDLKPIADKFNDQFTYFNKEKNK